MRYFADYRLRHFVNNVSIHIYAHDYMRIEITVLYFKISQHQLSTVNSIFDHQISNWCREIVKYNTVIY